MGLATDLSNNRRITLDTNGGLVVQPMVGVGPQGPAGLPGSGSPAWVAAEAVTTSTVRQAPDGSFIRSTASRTTRSTFDSTEQGFWAPVLATAGTLENSALLASYARLTSTDGEVVAGHALPAPTGVGVELVFTGGALDDIRINGTSA